MKHRIGIYLCLLIILTLCMGGCEETEKTIEVETPGEQQARLVAIENVQLKQQIQKINRDLRSQKNQINSLKASLKKSQEVNNDLINLLKEEGNWQQFDELLSNASQIIESENKKLLQENIQLQSEIEKLKSRIIELEDGS